MPKLRWHSKSWHLKAQVGIRHINQWREYEKASLTLDSEMGPMLSSTVRWYKSSCWIYAHQVAEAGVPENYLQATSDAEQHCDPGAVTSVILQNFADHAPLEPYYAKLALPTATKEPIYIYGHKDIQHVATTSYVTSRPPFLGLRDIFDSSILFRVTSKETRW